MPQVSKYAKWRPKGIDPVDEQEMVAMVRYSTLSYKDIVRYFVRRHPVVSAKIEPKKLKEKVIKRVICHYKELAEMVIDTFKPYPDGRCPKCKAQLKSRRCLACDLKAGIVTRIPKLEEEGD